MRQMKFDLSNENTRRTIDNIALASSSTGDIYSYFDCAHVYMFKRGSFQPDIHTMERMNNILRYLIYIELIGMFPWLEKLAPKPSLMPTNVAQNNFKYLTHKYVPYHDLLKERQQLNFTHQKHYRNVFILNSSTIIRIVETAINLDDYDTDTDTYGYELKYAASSSMNRSDINSTFAGSTLKGKRINDLNIVIANVEPTYHEVKIELTLPMDLPIEKLLLNYVPELNSNINNYCLLRLAQNITRDYVETVKGIDDGVYLNIQKSVMANARSYSALNHYKFDVPSDIRTLKHASDKYREKISYLVEQATKLNANMNDPHDKNLIIPNSVYDDIVKQVNNI